MMVFFKYAENVQKVLVCELKSFNKGIANVLLLLLQLMLHYYSLSHTHGLSSVLHLST